MGSNVTNDNNNFGKQNMGSADWQPSSRVLAAPVSDLPCNIRREGG